MKHFKFRRQSKPAVASVKKESNVKIGPGIKLNEESGSDSEEEPVPYIKHKVQKKMLKFITTSK